MKEMFWHPKHMLFAPIYLRQGKKVKAETPRLPEAMPLEKQARQGSLRFVRNDLHTLVSSTKASLTRASSTRASSTSLSKSADLSSADLPNVGNTDKALDEHADMPSVDKPAYRFMIVGDSSAAGVGVDYQSQALLGQLLLQLFNSDMNEQYSSIDWQLHATTGHTSSDVLRRLYVLPASDSPLDLLIIVVGVNDATQMQSLSKWQQNLSEILLVATHKYQPKKVIFTALPPMTQFPAMPYPLNEFIGAKSTQLDHYMQEFCRQHEHLCYVDFDIPVDSNSTTTDYFASDGFHPSGLTYRLWAERLANEVIGKVS